MVVARDHKSARLQERLRDLHRLLMELVRLHQELVELTQRKLMAMRKSDVSVMQACAQCEEELTDQIRQQDGIRKHLVVLIGKDLDLDEEKSKTLSISELTSHLEEKQCVKLRAVASQLSSLLAQVAKVNTVVALFAHQMLEHYRRIFEDITSGITDSPVYESGGRKLAGATAQVFDTRG